MSIPRWRLALTAGALVVLGALGGGLVQAAAVPGASTTAASAGPDAAASSAVDDAVLLDAFALLSDPTSSGAAIPVQLVGLRERIQERIANVRGHLVHGTLTVVDRDGKLVTYQFDHGTLSEIGSSSITIAEAGGTSVTVSTSSATRVRKDAKSTTIAALRVGDEVVVRSTVTGGSATAHLVVVPPVRTATAPSSGGNG